MIALDEILGLVGTLDDKPGDDTPRQRFRAFLSKSLLSSNDVRDYVETCLRHHEPQYDHALQDLVNHAASLLGFQVTYGRYRGVTNDIGFDGLWVWKGFAFVAEVKTTDTYAIQAAPVVGYVDKLISEGRISDWDHAIGLYVFGRSDSGLMQLANTIIAEKRTSQLRIATIESLLSLVDLVQDQQISADEAAALLKPGGVFVADTIQLLARIAARAVADPADIPVPVPMALTPANTRIAETAPVVGTGATISNNSALLGSDVLYLLTPVSDEGDATAVETISDLLSEGWYVFGDRTAGRKRLKPGDQICFYQSGVGVIAATDVASVPERKAPLISADAKVKDLENFPWSFRVCNPRFFFDDPVVLSADLRARLDAFANRDPNRSWSWFVQGTHQVTCHDFRLLTRE